MPDNIDQTAARVAVVHDWLLTAANAQLAHQLDTWQGAWLVKQGLLTEVELAALTIAVLHASNYTPLTDEVTA